MDKKILVVALAVLFVGILAAAELAAAEGPPVLCNMTMEGLQACRPSVTRPNPPPPSAVCCAALAKADLPCFCAFKKSNPGLIKALGIDPDLAMQLPAKCGIPAPAKC